MFRYTLLFISALIFTSTVRADVLEGYDSIDEFQFSGGSWFSSVSGTESILLERPTAVAANNNFVYFIDSGLSSLYAYNQVSGNAKGFSSAFGKIQGNIASLYISHLQDLFIVDTFGNQILQFDIEGNYRANFEDPLNLNSPVGVCVNPSNNHVFVADGFYSHIIEFTESGDPVALHGKRTRGQTQAGNNIIGMACNDQELYIVSKLSDEINVFTFSGKLIRQIPRKEVHNPTAVALDQYNRVYISDAFDDRIRVYDDQRMIVEFGGAGMDDFSFRDIRGLWVDNSFLYVADSMNRRIQILNITRPTSRYAR